MNLYVGNLLPNVSEKDLRKAFKQFGPVQNIRIIADRKNKLSNGYGFIVMSSKNDAEKAIEEMNGKEFMGQTINVNPAKPKINRRAGGRSRDFTNRGQGRRY